MISLNLPAEAQILGGLYPPNDSRYLDEEMLRVDFGGFSIDVSWDPAYDVDGEYLVTLYRGNWDNQLNSFCTCDVFQVKAYIEDTIEQIASTGMALAASSSFAHPAVTGGV